MFCPNCGTQNPDVARFCKSCGTSLGSDNTDVTPHKPTPKALPVQKKTIAAIAIGLVCVLVLFGAFYLFGGRSYKATVKTYINSTFEAKPKPILKLIPKKALEELMEDDGYDPKDRDDMQYFLDEMTDAMEDMIESLEWYVGDDWEVTYEIVEVADVKGKDMRDIRNAYKKLDVKVSAAKEIEVELHVEGEDMDRDTTMYIDVIKVGSSWYLDVIKMSNLF